MKNALAHYTILRAIHRIPVICRRIIKPVGCASAETSWGGSAPRPRRPRRALYSSHQAILPTRTDNVSTGTAPGEHTTDRFGRYRYSVLVAYTSVLVAYTAY